MSCPFSFDVYVSGYGPPVAGVSELYCSVCRSVACGLHVDLLYRASASYLIMCVVIPILCIVRLIPDRVVNPSPTGRTR